MDTNCNYFSVEDELLFTRRFTEGYDLPDHRYELWLKSKHKDSHSTFEESSSVTESTQTACVITSPCHPRPVASSSAHPLLAASSSAHPLPVASSLAHPLPAASSLAHPLPVASSSAHLLPAASSSAHPLPVVASSAHPLPVVASSAHPFPVASSSAHPLPAASSSADPPASSSVHPLCIESPANLASISLISDFVSTGSSWTNSATSSPSLFTSNSDSSSILNTPKRSHTHSRSVSTPLKRSPFSDLLNFPVQNVRKSTSKTGKARVLTSVECLAALKEKENRKKNEADAKAKRLQDRLLKRKQKEEEQQSRLNERLRKAAEKEARREEKAKSRPAGKRSVSTRPSPPSAFTQKRRNCGLDDNIYSDLCCVCFGSFAEDEGTGREWLQCSCTRWIHLDCMDTTESSNKLCPLC